MARDERVGALRYDVLMNTSGVTKGVSEAKRQFKVLQSVAEKSKDKFDRLEENIGLVQRSDLTKKQKEEYIRALKEQFRAENGYLTRREKAIQDEQARRRKAEQDAAEERKKIANKEERDREARMNRAVRSYRDLQYRKKMMLREEERLKRDYERRRIRRDQRERRDVYDRYLRMNRADSNFVKKAIVRWRKLASERRKAMGAGTNAAILGNVVGGLGAGGPVIGASRAFTQLSGASLGAAAGITAAAVAGTQMLRVADRMQHTLIDLEVFLNNDAQAAEDMVKRFQLIARQTPLTTQQLAEGATQLLAFGAAAEDVEPILMGIGTLAAGNREKFRLLTKGMADITAMAKLQGQELRQLANQGWNPLEEMHRMTGKSLAELRKEMELGKISAEQVYEALANAQERYAQRLPKAMNTISGQWGRLMGLLEELGGKTGQAGINPITRQIETAADATELVVMGVEKGQSVMEKFQQAWLLSSQYAEYLAKGGKKDREEWLAWQRSMYEQKAKEVAEIEKQIALERSWKNYRDKIETADMQYQLSRQEELDKLLDKAEMLDMRYDLNHKKELRRLRIEQKAREEGASDEGVAKALEIDRLKRENAATIKRQDEAFKKREEDIKAIERKGIESLQRVHEADMKRLAESRAEMEKVADLAQNMGGPSVDFSKAGADYQYVQQRTAQITSERMMIDLERRQLEQLTLMNQKLEADKDKVMKRSQIRKDALERDKARTEEARELANGT